MIKLKSIIIFLLTLAFISDLTGQSEEELRHEINSLNEKLINSIMDGSLDDYISIYTDDAVVMLPFMAPLKGKHALISHFHNIKAKGDEIESSDFRIIDIWTSGDLIYERGSYQITYKRHSNNIRAIHGSYFSVWERQKDGSLKIKYDIANLDHGI